MRVKWQNIIMLMLSLWAIQSVIVLVFKIETDRELFKIINRLDDIEAVEEEIDDIDVSVRKEDKKVVEPIKVVNNDGLRVCSTSSVKTYMSYKKITSRSSAQYRYIQKNMTVNDEGFLVDKDGRIGVALGSYFGKIGSKFDFTLSTGIVLKVVKVEAKSDSHTVNGCYQKYDKSVIEFVIDSSKFSKGANGYVKNGNFNNDSRFKGKISKIEEVK